MLIDATTVQYGFYIVGSICFAVGSCIGLYLHLTQ